jgi:transcriptional regulator with XRE-family HTH domain
MTAIIPTTTLKELLQAVAKAITEARLAKNWTQTELARRLNVKVPFVTRMESGTHNPTLKTVQAFADELGISIYFEFSNNR